MPLKETRILAELPRLRGNRQVHRWVLASAGVASLLSVVSTSAFVPLAFDTSAASETVVVQLAHPNPIIPDATDAVYAREDRVRPGDTLASLMRRIGIDDPQAAAFLRTDPMGRALQSRLRTGQTISARFAAGGELQSLSYRLPGTDRALVVERRGNELSAAETSLVLEPRLQTRSGIIRSSLFAAADEIGLPDAVTIQLAEIFGAEIDFNTDLRRGDRFTVVYQGYSHNGNEAKSGRVLAAEFVNDGTPRRAIWYDGGNGSSGYCTPEGHSLKKAFLRSPLEFSRISSGFAMRFHPLLREWRAHKGVDYAAPTGTSVLATADGTVEFIGRQRGYGNFVVLRHHDQYSTAYGHLSGFASGLRQGSRVEQGDVIGFVGRTGWATGPHLHYEFRIADVHQDPLSVALPVSIPLSTSQLREYRSAAEPLLARMALISGMKIAKAE